MRLLSLSTIGGKSYESEKNEMEPDEAREKHMGRRKVGWARSKCIGISVPIDPGRESKYTKEGTFVQERDDTDSD
jgi:hypothetical protein